MELAAKETCTGCGACAYVCPKKCITFELDETFGISYPVIDDSLCIDCGRCRTYCPVLNPLESAEPVQAYAAWSSDAEERRTSASGGIAAEIYKYAIASGWLIVGAAFGENFEVRLKLADNAEAIKDFKNSKYVFSTIANVYHDLDEKLKTGCKIAIIALPCQIAAFKKVFHKYKDNLLLVDLVCHGTTPPFYLDQYIRYMEAKYKKGVGSIIFRDPEIGTQKFALSLYDTSGQRFYSSHAVGTNDIYQFGYHQMVTYRENCYRCPYANRKRISDITLSDYKGLGNMSPCSFSEEKVSCILLNSKKGEKIVKDFIATGRIEAEMRSVEEPIKGDSQLQHPSNRTYARYLFEKEYTKLGDFVPVMKNVYRINQLRERIIWGYYMPMRIINKVKRMFHISL